MARTITYSFPACATTAICASQTTGAAGALAINGSLLDLPATMCGVNRVVLPGIQRVLTITSGGNLSAINYTITGKDLTGATVTATGAGPNATTATTSVEFHEIDSVSFDGAVSSSVIVGTGSSGKTNWAITSGFQNPNNITVGVAITATTVVATVQNTLDDVQTATGPTTYNHPTLASISVSTESNYAYPPRAVRATFSGVTATGSAIASIIQAG